MAALKCVKYKKGKQRPSKCIKITLIVAAAAVSNSRGQTLPDPGAALLAYGNLKGNIGVSRAPKAMDNCFTGLQIYFFVLVSKGVLEFYFQKM